MGYELQRDGRASFENWQKAVGGAGRVGERWVRVDGGGEAKVNELFGAEDEGVTVEDRCGKEHERVEGRVIEWADGWRADGFGSVEGVDAVSLVGVFAEGNALVVVAEEGDNVVGHGEGCHDA